MLVALLLACGPKLSPPPAPADDPSPAYEALLQRVVTDEGFVDYDLLRADPAPLAAYVGWIAEHGPESDGFRLLDDDRRLAWHINAYNALVLWGVLQHWPLESVRDVPGPLGIDGAGFFWWMRVRVDGEWTTLHHHEQAFLFPTYQEPLAHAALNCASWSCPPLRSRLYTARELDAELDAQMRRWVATGAARVEGDGFVFSQIFEWYADHFREWAGASTPCATVRPYAEGPLAAALDARPDCPHRFEPYDWRLNHAPKLTPPAALDPTGSAD